MKREHSVSHLRNGRDAGFALVMVLWFSGLLALLSMNLLREGGATKKLAVTNMARLQAEAVVDGAINLTILKLLNRPTWSPLQLDGSDFVLRTSGMDVTLKIEREAGKIDLNTANSPILIALLCSVGATESEAEVISAGVIAWRTPIYTSRSDSVDHLYFDAGRPYGPRHGAFRAIAELRLVLGMTDALQAAVVPLVTIWSPNAGIDCEIASVFVLGVLATASKALMASDGFGEQNTMGSGCNRSSFLNETVTIVARIGSSNSFIQRQAVVRFAQTLRKSFSILDWH